MRRSIVFLAFLVGALFLAPVARAQGEGGAAAAESLFQEGRKLMDAKKYAEACPKFAASQKLSEAIGTLLNLADCYEKNGQLASAWVRFHEAVGMAKRKNRPDREATARERAERLEPKLIKLSILSHSSNLEVKLDGLTIDSAVLGSPIPVDAGKHTLEASAKGKKTYTKDFELSEKSRSPTIDIPPLEEAGDSKDPKKDSKKDEKKDEKKDGEKKDETKSSKFTEPPKEERKAWPMQKTLGIVAASVGLVAVGAGTYFGIKTSSTWKDVKTRCGESLECPDETAVSLADDAQTSGNIATVAVIGGAALLVTGAVLFFTAQNDSRAGSLAPRTVKVGVGPGSLVLGGTF